MPRSDGRSGCLDESLDGFEVGAQHGGCIEVLALQFRMGLDLE
jgi:hypothetical protein